MDLGADPHRPEMCGDVLDTERLGQHLSQRVDIGLECGSVAGAVLGGLQLGAHIAGQVGGGVDELVGLGVGEHQRVQRDTGFGLAHAEYVRDQRQVDPARPVKADRDRIGRGLHTLNLGTGRDHSASHDRGRAGGLVGVVELLQRQHQRPERIAAEQPGRGRHDPGVGVLPSIIAAAGAPQRVPVQRAVLADVLLVAALEVGASFVDLVGVIDRRGLQRQQPGRRVPQPE